MRQITLQQSLQKVNDEVSRMTSWAQRKLDFGNRQGSLDVRYLASRFDKGRKKVQTFCEQQHKISIIENENFGTCQADVVRFTTAADASGQSPLGQTIFRSKKFSGKTVASMGFYSIIFSFQIQRRLPLVDSVSLDGL